MTTRALISVLAATSLLVAACGTGDDDAGDTTVTEPSDDTGDITTTEPSDGGVVALAERAAPTADAALAGEAVTSFGFDLLTATAAVHDGGAATENLIVSPLSVAIALAMLEPGANDQALEQLHDLLGIDDPEAWHASMNALEQTLEARVAELPGGGGPDDEQDPGEFVANVANAAFLQPGYPFLPDYLDAIGTNYGAVLEELDFGEPETAAERINGFIADETDDLITDLVQPSDIDPATVLALVNALLLRASWETTFDADATVDDEFTLVDGSTVTVPMMSGLGDRSGRGDGWVAASKRLVGDVRVDVVLPDEGRFDEIAARIADVLGEYDLSANPPGALGVPRFETRVTAPLTDALKAAGLTAPFDTGQLMGIADDPRLVLDKALHQTFLAVDEDGIEAAAATVLLALATSAPIEEPVDVVLDRPFLVRIVDDISGATLFLGRIMDPTS